LLGFKSFKSSEETSLKAKKKDIEPPMKNGQTKETYQFL